MQGITVNIEIYKRKRDLLCDGLAQIGYSFNRPQGAFYLFPKSPIPDDVRFVKSLQEKNILTVPGSGFGAPGYFRIAYCVREESIINAMPGFQEVLHSYC
jgi:aspartate aminotransferase